MVKKSINSILKKVALESKPDKRVVENMKGATKQFIDVLNDELGKAKTGAEAFVGGSYARGTFVKGDYDVDVFVRFDWKFENISPILENALKRVCARLDLNFEKVHGSRDYFKVHNKAGQWYFELIPVTKIKKPSEERNVTDLSYFHVPYVKKKIKGLESYVRIAKLFFKSQGVYGAETYVRGFSGYSLELLIIYYKSFLKMLKELVKLEKGKRLVIDIEKHFRKKDSVFIELNEAKLHSPVILIDPTYKERNALAALGHETFYRFQESARKFLKNPSEKFFVKEEVDIEKLKQEAKKKKAEFVHMQVKTDKQAGDIAGTKLKKFSESLLEEIGRYFIILKSNFEYNELQKADLYIIAKSKKEIVRVGPPLEMKKHVNAFKREHMKTYIKNGVIHAKIKVVFGCKEYADVWAKANRDKIKQMSIVEIKVI